MPIGLGFVPLRLRSAGMEPPDSTTTAFGSQFGALSALCECLSAATPVVRARYAHVTFAALETALEARSTSPRLLQPLLGALMQVPLPVLG